MRRTVLFVVPSLGGGGAERVVLSLARNLDRQHFRILLAVVDSGPQTLRAEVPPDVELIEFGVPRVRHALGSLVRTAWRTRPDVIFTVIGHLNLALSLLRPFLPRGTRLIARETNVLGSSIQQTSRPWLWRLAFRWLYPRLDRIVCQSYVMQRELVRDFKVREDRTIVLRNPVDLERIVRLAAEPLPDGARPPGRWLVSAGRLSAEKGFDILIEALALLPEPRPVLTLLGEGAEERSLRALARERGVDHLVRFAGFQSNPYPWLAAADAMVLSSRFESFPNAVLDALACGTPVIAVPSPGGIGELLPGPAGSVVADAVTPEALARCIASFTFRDVRQIPVEALAPYMMSEVLAGYSHLLDARVGAES